MKWLVKFVLIVWLLPVNTTAQACCSLQGHFQSSAVEQYPYYQNFSSADAHSLQLSVQSGNDLAVDAFITEGPRLTVSLDYHYRAEQFFGLVLGIRTTTTRLQENISFEARDSYLLSTELNGRVMVHGDRHLLWIRTSLPLVTKYSNAKFPFKVSPSVNLEAGMTTIFGSDRHLQSFSAIWVEQLGNRNLFRFRHQLFFNYRVQIAQWKRWSPYIALKNKFGVLKSISAGVYQNDIQETAYDFGVLGAGVNWQFKHYPVVIRLDWNLPVMKWSEGRLPAGFSENPSLNLMYSGPIYLHKTKRK